MRLIAMFAFLAIPVLYPSEPQAPNTGVIPLSRVDEIVDVVVSGSGKAFVLTKAGFETVEIERSVSVPVNLMGLLPPADSVYTRIRHNAVAITREGIPVILWTGRLEDGGLETCLTSLDSGATEKLERPLGRVLDLSLGSNGDIYVLGLQVEDSGHLVHHYSGSGQYLDSFHSFHPGGEWASSGHMVVVGPALYVALSSRPFDGTIYEYHAGNLARRYDFEQVPEQARILMSMFSMEDAVYTHSVVGKKIVIDPEKLPPELGSNIVVKEDDNEIHALVEGKLVLVTSGGPSGTRFGMTPDGRFVAATLAGTTRVRRQPALSILQP